MSGYERSKAPLALMEQIIMILVFALASAVCLQAFVYSDRLSRTDEQKQNAMTKAQLVTEYCKGCQGDLERVCGPPARRRGWSYPCGSQNRRTISRRPLFR